MFVIVNELKLKSKGKDKKTKIIPLSSGPYFDINVLEFVIDYKKKNNEDIVDVYDGEHHVATFDKNNNIEVVKRKYK